MTLLSNGTRVALKTHVALVHAQPGLTGRIIFVQMAGHPDPNRYTTLSPDAYLVRWNGAGVWWVRPEEVEAA